MQKLFRSVPSVNRSPIRYAIWNAPFWFEKNNLPKRGSGCNFCSDKSVQIWFGPFQKPIRYGTFHFQQRSGAVLFRSRNCFESTLFLVWTEALSGTLSATLRFTIRYSVNISLTACGNYCKGLYSSGFTSRLLFLNFFGGSKRVTKWQFLLIFWK